MRRNPVGRVLIIAGSDSGGGAGIQGDIKTVTCLGGYASTAITALTAQNTHGVFGIHNVPPDFIQRQIELVLEDIGADCIKTGMLHKTDVIVTIAKTLERYGAGIPLVLDPVMFAKGGAALLQEASVECLKQMLIPKAFMITPNIPEAECLTGMTIDSVEKMEQAAQTLMQTGPKSVLLKGGHMQGDVVTDVLLTASGTHHFTQGRIESQHTHGTGCTLASAIATLLSQGNDAHTAVEKAHAYVREAIVNAPHIGGGHGPLGHNFAFQKKII